MKNIVSLESRAEAQASSVKSGTAKAKGQISELAELLANRIEELKSRRTQAEIAEDAGFVNKNVLSIIKRGDTKLSLDRVEAMAKALDLDLRSVMIPALRQYFSDDVIGAIRETFLDDLTKAELELIALARASTNTKQGLSYETREALKEILAKNKAAGS